MWVRPSHTGAVLLVKLFFLIFPEIFSGTSTDAGLTISGIKLG